MDFEQNGGNLTRQIIIVETQLRSLLLLLSLVQGYSPSSVTGSCCMAWALLFHEWVWFPFLLLYTLPDYFLRPLTQFMFTRANKSMSQARASHSRETGGTDDGIKRIHLSSKLPTRNSQSRISKAEREAFKTKHAFWVYFKDSRDATYRVACPKFTNIQ